MKKYGFNNPKYPCHTNSYGRSWSGYDVEFRKTCTIINAEYETYNGMSEENKINIFDIQPEKHTFVFIMELMRCADTVNKRIHRRFGTNVG